MPTMKDQTDTGGWHGERGEKWRQNIAPLEAMLAAVDPALIDALALDGPMRIADIGCGGGRTSLAILNAAPAGSEVVGIDVAPSLIDLARARAAGHGDRIAFRLGDAGQMPPDGPAFDRLTSRFGVMFFDDPAAALSNLAGWLKPGGRFAFAVWGPPADNPWMLTVRDAVATVADWPRPDPEAPGPFRYADAEGFSDLLTVAGFDRIEVQDWRARIPLGGGMAPAEAAAFAIGAFSIAEALSGLDEAAVEAARASLETTLSHHTEDGIVMIGARAHIVTGRRAEGPRDP